MRSMTGFGHASGENQTYAISVAARGVNHRYLDLRLRLDNTYVSSETALRELFAAEIRRGRVEVRVDVQRLGPRPVRVEIQRDVLVNLAAAFRELQDKALIREGLTAGDLLRLPDVLRIEASGEDWGAEGEKLLLEVAGGALEQLMSGREREGRVIGEALAERLSLLEEQALVMVEQRPQAVEEIRQNLDRRLQDLLGGTSLDPGRFEQEVAVLVERTDIQEELDRLKAHLGHFSSLMEDEKSLGKRLDFLTQEILRELNTLGSKCRAMPMTRAVLEAKALCDQLREQVQNIE